MCHESSSNAALLTGRRCGEGGYAVVDDSEDGTARPTGARRRARGPAPPAARPVLAGGPGDARRPAARRRGRGRGLPLRRPRHGAREPAQRAEPARARDRLSRRARAPEQDDRRDLGISSWTVSTHLRRMFAKFGVNSRAALVAKIVEEQLVQDRPSCPGETLQTGASASAEAESTASSRSSSRAVARQIELSAAP